MPAPLDLERLRHVKSQPYCAGAERWKEFKGALDGIGGVLLQSGLVHALLVAIKNRTDKKAGAGPVLVALCGWLQHEKCPVKDEVKALLAEPPPAGVSDTAEKLAAALIGLGSVRDAMAIQAEAVRYLVQAKLLADAFGGDGP